MAKLIFAFAILILLICAVQVIHAALLEFVVLSFILSNWSHSPLVWNRKGYIGQNDEMRESKNGKRINEKRKQKADRIDE